MRIAYLVNQYPKTSHTFIRREILALERAGLEIMRISLRGWDSELVDPLDELERSRTRYVLRDGALPLILALLRTALFRPLLFTQALVLTFRFGWRSERPLPVHFVYLAEACQIELWLRREKIKHLHAHFGTNSAEVAMLVNLLGGPPWSFTVHGPEEFDKPRFIGLPEKIRRSSFVVAISSFGRSQLFRLVETKYWPKIHVIRCGLDRSFFESPEPALIPKVPRFICVGRLCEQKGQLLLLEAAARLKASGAQFDLVLAGDGEMRREVDEFISKYHLGSIVHVTGWIAGDRIRQELLAATALVLPSFAEGLPVVIMEAMALRRPVISTYVAGIPELVSAGEHGWLVPAGDVDALTLAMQDCINCPGQALLEMGNCAHDKVLQFHDIEQQAGKIRQLFEATPGPRPPNVLKRGLKLEYDGQMRPNPRDDLP